MIGGIAANDKRLRGTIEFFPEEGKYHYDGHREHHVKLSPEASKALGDVCPACGKPLTVGVDHRVDDLADRPLGEKTPPKTVEYIVPLVEVIAELNGTKSVSGKAVIDRYERLIGKLGDEFSIVRTLPLEVMQAYDQQIAVAVQRIRTNQVYKDPGYDGVYGTVKVFKDGAEKAAILNQTSLL